MTHGMPESTPMLAMRLAELDDLRRRLRTEVGIPSRRLTSLRRFAKAQIAQSSVAIEGYYVPLDKAKALASGDLGQTGNQNEEALSCYLRAMEHVDAMSDDPHFVWSERVILDLHFDVCYFQRGVRPGQWRQGPIYVKNGPEIVYEAPPADAVPELMAEVVHWLEHGDRDVHPIVRAAMAHLHVVSIHPFRDGNGRVSRITQSLVLARERLLSPEFASIEEYLREHTGAYFSALAEAHGPVYDPSLSAHNWVMFCVNAHIHQAQRRLEQIEAAERRWNTCDALVQEHRWPERFVMALEQSLTGAVTNTSYRLEEGITDRQARADLNRLADAGLLIRQGAGRSTSYVASDALRAVVDAATAMQRQLLLSPTATIRAGSTAHHPSGSPITTGSTPTVKRAALP